MEWNDSLGDNCNLCNPVHNRCVLLFSELSSSSIPSSLSHALMSFFGLPEHDLEHESYVLVMVRCANRTMSQSTRRNFWRCGFSQ